MGLVGLTARLGEDVSDFGKLADFLINQPMKLRPIDHLNKAMRKFDLDEEPRTAGFDVLLRVQAFLNFGPPAIPGESTRRFDPEEW